MAAAEAEGAVSGATAGQPASSPAASLERGRTRLGTATHRKGQPGQDHRKETVDGDKAGRIAGDRCPSCGAKALTGQELVIARKPGRRSQRDANDPRNRPENLVTLEFLRQHVVVANMSLRDIGMYHGYTISTLSRRAKHYGVVLSHRGRQAVEAGAAADSDAEGTEAAANGGPGNKEAGGAGGVGREAGGPAADSTAADEARRAASPTAPAASGKLIAAKAEQRGRVAVPAAKTAMPAKPAAAKRKAEPSGMAGKPTRKPRRSGISGAAGAAPAAEGDVGLKQQAQVAPKVEAVDWVAAAIPFGIPLMGPLTAVPPSAALQPQPSMFEAWAAQHQQSEEVAQQQQQQQSEAGPTQQQQEPQPQEQQGQGAKPRDPKKRQAAAARGGFRALALGVPRPPVSLERKALPPRKRRRTTRYDDRASEGEASLGAESDVDSDGVDALNFLVAEALRASQQEEVAEGEEEQPGPKQAGGWALSQQEAQQAAGAGYGVGGTTPERPDAAAIGSEEQQPPSQPASQEQPPAHAGVCVPTTSDAPPAWQALAEPAQPSAGPAGALANRGAPPAGVRQAAAARGKEPQGEAGAAAPACAEGPAPPAATDARQRSQRHTAPAADEAPRVQAPAGPALAAPAASAEAPAAAARPQSRRKQKPGGPAASGAGGWEEPLAGAAAAAPAGSRLAPALAAGRKPARPGKASGSGAAAAAARSSAPLLGAAPADLVEQRLRSAEVDAGAAAHGDSAAAAPAASPAAGGSQPQQQASAKPEPRPESGGGTQGGAVQARAAQEAAQALQAAPTQHGAPATAARQQHHEQQVEGTAKEPRRPQRPACALPASLRRHHWRTLKVYPGVASKQDPGADTRRTATAAVAATARELAGKRGASPPIQQADTLQAEGRSAGQQPPVKQEPAACRDDGWASEVGTATVAPAAAATEPAAPADAAALPAVWGAASAPAAAGAAAAPALLAARRDVSPTSTSSPTTQPAAFAATSAPAAPAPGPAASAAPPAAPSAAPDLATAAVTAAATAHVLRKAMAAFQRADMRDAQAMLRPLSWLSVAGKGGELLADYVRRWHSLPSELQHDLFSTSLLVAQQGGLDRLEDVLRLGLG